MLSSDRDHDHDHANKIKNGGGEQIDSSTVDWNSSNQEMFCWGMNDGGQTEVPDLFKDGTQIDNVDAVDVYEENEYCVRKVDRHLWCNQWDEEAHLELQDENLITDGGSDHEGGGGIDINIINKDGNDTNDSKVSYSNIVD